MNDFDRALGRLLSAFNHHVDLRSRKASVPELAESAVVLHRARMDARRALSHRPATTTGHFNR